MGEFGYELLNWQGVVRKFSRTISPSDKIVCCSRRDLYPLYETASTYIDISEVNIFKKSIASAYFALHPADLNNLESRLNIFFDWCLKRELRSFILQRLGSNKKTLPSKLYRLWKYILRDVSQLFSQEQEYVFIFSSDRTELNGCIFGSDRKRYKPDIYDSLNLENNIYRKIEPDLSVKSNVERKLGWALETPFVLCQTRSRKIVVRSQDIVPKERIIKALSREINVVLLEFHTGRYFDSYSSFDHPTLKNQKNIFIYKCQSFVEQICLIHFAKHCLFFTEGDFGSHIYIPPFLGKNVTAVAPKSVYQLGTSPIDFWNKNVFQFGGQIIPKVSEEVLSSQQSMRKLIYEILS